MKRILIALLVLLSAAACFSEKDASDIILFVTPPSDTTAVSGEKLLYEIETWTIHQGLSSFEIKSFDLQNGTLSLFRETNLATKYTGTYIYEVPKFESDETTVTLIFTVTDSDGHFIEKKIDILVSNDGVLQKEYSSVTLYPAHSGKADAFSLKDFTAVSSSASDESLLDVYLYADPESDPDRFVPEWRSMTGLMFARANDMDYSSITKSALNVFFKNSRKSENITAISNDDIIIIGRENTAIGVFKIILVQDAPGSADDRLLFSFKPAV